MCPRCGSSAEVRTVRELFDMLNAMQANARQQAAPPPVPQGDNPGPDPEWYQPDQQIANLVVGMAARAVGKLLQRPSDKRIASAQQAQAQEDQQAQHDQVAIVERYPDLRGCLRDFVLFLPGGITAVPISELRMPVTLAQADALMARLQAP
jgi:hypothetical protein